MQLHNLGWCDAFAQALAPHLHDDACPARVTRVDRGQCTVLTEHGSRRAHSSPLLDRQRRDAADPRDAAAATPAVGDWVVVDAAGTISAIAPRRSSFMRQSNSAEALAQVLAANVDIAFVVQSLEVPVNQRRLERYLALAWQGGATPVVLLTKCDLVDDPTEAIATTAEVAIGVEVLPVSTLRGDGFDRLAELHADGSTSVLLGLSGAGKSTLVNRLHGEHVLSVQETRGDGKGRHTTTWRQLVPLPGGGCVIDTPGMRELQLWDAAEGLEQVFGDVDQLIECCRFADCVHETEPGCAVLAALDDGSLDSDRWASWQKLQRELAFHERKTDARKRAIMGQQMRVQHRAYRRDAKPRRW